VIEPAPVTELPELLRPFFWVMVGLTVLAPVAIAFARRGRNQSV
jgi:hypothetical protein